MIYIIYVYYVPTYIFLMTKKIKIKSVFIVMTTRLPTYYMVFAGKEQPTK